MADIQEQPAATDLRRRIFQVQRLAAMPRLIWHIMDALADENASASKVAKIIESDPALASKVLSLANSAYYGMRQKITTIQHAIVIIGFQELEFLALGAGLADFFEFKKLPKGFDAEALWLHSLGVSWIAREMGTRLNYPNPGELLVAGLLHDLGKLILAAHLPHELDMIVDHMKNGTPYYQAEEELGLKHAMIGYWLAKRWALPDLHAASIRDHHTPNPNDPFYQVTCIVALADKLVKELEIGMVQESRPLETNVLMAAIGISDEAWNSLKKSAEEQVPIKLKAWWALLAQK